MAKASLQKQWSKKVCGISPKGAPCLMRVPSMRVLNRLPISSWWSPVSLRPRKVALSSGCTVLNGGSRQPVRDCLQVAMTGKHDVQLLPPLKAGYPAEGIVRNPILDLALAQLPGQVAVAVRADLLPESAPRRRPHAARPRIVVGQADVVARALPSSGFRYVLCVHLSCHGLQPPHGSIADRMHTSRALPHACPALP